MAGDDDATTSTRERLLEALLTVAADLDLTSTLERIVAVACDLAGARYGALGVVGTHVGDQTLVEFVHQGVDEPTVERIGHLPEGHGILGLLVREPEPLRLRDLTRHAAAHGFPPGHPPMRSFLGAPILVRDEVFGNIYLTEKLGSEEFSADDQELVEGLAAVAGVAIANARLYEQVASREAWRRAVQDVTTSMLLGADTAEVHETVAAAARSLLDADLTAVVVPGPRAGGGEDALEVVAAAGAGSGAFVGRTAPATGSLLAEVLGGGDACLVAPDTPASFAPLSGVAATAGAVVPLRGSGRTLGVLVATRAADGPWRDDDLHQLEQFARQASLAIEFGRARAEVSRLQLLEDRERIGRDLHDTVIQQLFAAGLELQGLARRTGDPTVTERLDRVVDELDGVIRQIRTTIFALQGEQPEGLRGRVLGVARSLAPALGFAPQVVFEGPVDSLVPVPVAEQVAPVVREALSNVAKHAGASRVQVTVRTDGEELEVVVLDDGRGMPQEGAGGGLGLGNLRQRARLLGGDAEVGTPAAGEGLQVRWWVPLD
ncbi:MAG: GAF domain-containing protein [Actinomycetes bacterium]